MTQGSARQLRKLVGATLRRSGPVTETTIESGGKAGSVSREVIEASVAALGEQLRKSVVDN